MTTPTTPAQEEAERAILAAQQTALRSFIHLLTTRHELVEDILSDVNFAILEDWDRYDPKRPFIDWAKGVARKVTKARLRAEGRRPLWLDDEMLDMLEKDINETGCATEPDRRLELLRTCVARLPAHLLRLVQFKYYDDRAYPEISQMLRRSVHTLYVMYSRLHHTLRSCVTRKLHL